MTYEENKLVIRQSADDMFTALREVKEAKQYKEEYGTWENFLIGEGLSGTKWRTMLQHQTVIGNLESVGIQTPNEAQAVQLAPLEPEQQIEVWEKVLSNGEPVTAKAIKETKIELYEAETIEAEEVESKPLLEFESFEDTGDRRIEVFQFCLRNTAEIKSYSKYKEWLTEYVNYLITKHNEDEN